MGFVSFCVFVIHFVIHTYCKAIDNVLQPHKQKFVEKWKAVFYHKATMIQLPPTKPVKKKKTPKSTTKKAKKQSKNKSSNASDLTKDQIEFLLDSMQSKIKTGTSCDYKFKTQLEQEVAVSDEIGKCQKAMARYNDVILVFGHLGLIPPGLLLIADKS